MGGSECVPISYITGGITISPKPPSNFSVGVNVFIGPLQAALKGPEVGANHIVWQYLAVVRPGPASVRCIVGDISVEKQVEAKPNSVEIVNFCFGEPVQMEPCVKLGATKKAIRSVTKKRLRQLSGVET